MQTHPDRPDHTPEKTFTSRLEERALESVEEGSSQITGGKPGEETLAEWEYQGVFFRELPPDEQGILRVSIGGGNDTPTKINYCVLRGSRHKCIDLLRKALLALQSSPARPHKTPEQVAHPDEDHKPTEQEE